MKRLMREYQALCTMGLPTSDVVPLAVTILGQALGGNYLGFAWVDAQLELAGVYMATPIDQGVLDHYHQEFHNRRETEIVPGFKFSLIHKIPIVNYNRGGASFYRSALYNEYASVIGLHKAIRATVIDHDRRHGVLVSGRARAERAYSEQEEILCVWAARLLAQAFELERVNKLIDTDTIEDGAEGYLLADDAGRILHGSDLGLRWLQEVARFPASGIGMADRVLAQWLDDARRSGAGGEIAIATGLGQFVFRPLKLHSIKQTGRPVYVITVKRRGSKAALIWRETDQFHLSAREKQVAALLGSGYGNNEIANRLGIGSTTVITYVKRVFEKLGIDKREQLLRAIL
jgi:DNA-binding CsgD family transcriptional regulator